MKNIVGYSLWGNLPKYWEGAYRNIEINNKLLPNFISRFYVEDSCDENLIKKLKSYENVEVVLIDSTKSWAGMFWRFYAASDPEVNVYLSRDTDSRITEREVSAINEWLNSDKNFHIIRDHPYHGVAILGGMWGCRNRVLKNIDELIENWSNHTTVKGKWKDEFVAGDQNFLGEVIYPIVYHTAFEHSEFNIKGANPIHTLGKRVDYEFIGDSFDENENRNPDYWKIIKKYLDEII